MIQLVAYNAEASVAYYMRDERVYYFDALTNSIYASSDADMKEEAAHPPWEYCSEEFLDTDALGEWLNLLD